MTRTRDLPVFFPLSADPIRADVSADVAPVHRELDAAGDVNGPRIGLITLGCDKNTVDSERMMAALVGHGARVSSHVEDAEVVIVNTCGFIQAAKEQSIETILEACELKASGQLKAVVAVGCLVQRHGAELREEIPEVDLDLVGQTTTVLVDRLLDQDPEYAAVGRTPGPAKDIDGVTHLRADFDVRPGDMVQATIVEAMDYDLVAEVRVPQR